MRKTLSLNAVLLVVVLCGACGRAYTTPESTKPTAATNEVEEHRRSAQTYAGKTWRITRMERRRASALRADQEIDLEVVDANGYSPRR
jgi:hypothetical protein